MNASIIDPLQGDFPEVIEEYLEHGVMKCVAFNHRGNLLAAGCSDGVVLFGILKPEALQKNSEIKIAWVQLQAFVGLKYGRCVLVSAADKSLTLWDVVKGERLGRTVLQQTPLQARLHPGSSTPSICLACPLSSAPMIVDMLTETTIVLPVSLSETGNGAAPPSRVINFQMDLFHIHLLLRASTSALEEIDKENHKNSKQDEGEKLKSTGSRSLALFREFQDSITKVHWKAPCFSGDGEWVVGGSASKGEHKIYIWDRAGHLVKILEGPKEALMDLTWHPVKPVVVSVSLTGLVYIWAKDYTENWSAFAPDFKELEENEEYVGQEDEFDLVPETEKVKDLDKNEEVIDVATAERDSAFSDSDMSMEEICFLPPDPCPDVPEMEDGLDVNISKDEDISEAESPLSEDAGQNGHLTNHESSPLEEDTGGMCVKRKRMPSEKFMDFETDKTKKKSPSKSKP